VEPQPIVIEIDIPVKGATFETVLRNVEDVDVETGLENQK